MAYIVVLNPLIIGTQAADGQFLGGGTAPNLDDGRGRHGPGGRRDDHPDGRGRQLPAGAGDRPGAQRVRRLLDRQAAGDDLGRRDGPGRARGHHHPGAGAHRLPAGGLPRRAGAAQDGDHASASACSSRSSAWSTPASCARRPSGPVPGGARHRRLPHRLAAAGLRRSACCAIIACWSRGEGRDPLGIVGATVLAIVVEAIAQHRRPDRRDRQGRQPHRLGPERPGDPRARRRRPRLRHCSASSTCSARSSKIGIVAALLLVFTLMLADFFDTMGTMSAIGAEAGLLDEDGNPPERRADPHRRLGRRRGRWRGRRLVATRPTSSPPPASARGPAPAWPRWSPACCSCSRCSSRRWSPIVPYEAATPGAGPRRLPDDAAGQGHRLGRPRDRHPGVPHDRADAVHLLDHRGHRRRLRRLRAHQGRPRQGRAPSTRCCGWSRRCSSSTSPSTRSATPWASDPADQPRMPGGRLHGGHPAYACLASAEPGRGPRRGARRAPSARCAAPSCASPWTVRRRGTAVLRSGIVSTGNELC